MFHLFQKFSFCQATIYSTAISIQIQTDIFRDFWFIGKQPWLSHFLWFGLPKVASICQISLSNTSNIIGCGQVVRAQDWHPWVASSSSVLNSSFCYSCPSLEHHSSPKLVNDQLTCLLPCFLQLRYIYFIIR